MVGTDVRLRDPASSPGSRQQPGIILQGAGWFALTATVLSGLAPAMLIISTPLDRSSSGAWVWPWVVTVLIGLRYAWLVAQGTRRLFEIIVWLFIYVFMGLAPLVQLRSGQYPGTTPPIDPALSGVAMAVVGAGAVAFCVGLAFAGSGVTAPRGGQAPALSTHRLLALTAVALMISAYYIAAMGPEAMLSSRSERYAAEISNWPNSTVAVIVRAAATWPLLVSLVGLIALRRQRASNGLSGPAVLPWVVLPVLAVVVNPIASPRYVVGSALLAVVVALGATATPRRFRLFTVTLATGLVLVFPYADIARNPGELGAGKTGGVTEVLTTGDFDAFNQINNTLTYLEVEGHTAGRQLAGATLFWVPRAVWEDKPEDTGILLADFRGFGFTNASAPLWAELLINGGWPLLLVGMGALGWAVRKGDQRAARTAGTAPNPGVLAVILPFYSILLLRGSLLQAMAGFAVILACGLFVSRRSTLLS